MKKFVSNPWVIFASYIISVAGLINSFVIDNIILHFFVSVFLIFYLIALTFFTLFKLLSMKKIRNELEKEYYEKQVNTFYFLEDIFEEIYKKKSIIHNSCKDEDNLFVSSIENICGMIQNNIKTIFNLDFNVCFKSICVDSVISSDIDNWETQTIARSAKANYLRRIQDNSRQKLMNNTSFSSIVMKKDSTSWASYNLPELVKNMEKNGFDYKNPNENYVKFYKSTIVVPVRGDVSRIPSEIKSALIQKEKLSYHYLGFLCIDSKEVFSNEDMIFNNLIYLLIFIGNILYDICLEKLLNEYKIS